MIHSCAFLQLKNLLYLYLIALFVQPVILTVDYNFSNNSLTQLQ